MIIGKTYNVDSVADFYKAVAPDLLNANEVSPKGLKTKEMIAPKIILHDPRNRLVYNKERNFNIFHALNEAIMLFSPSNKVEHISEFNKNMAKFSDDGKTMFGSYGKRIAFNIHKIVSILKADKDSRQAVLTIHRMPDLAADTKDVPCTQALQFLIRDNKLLCITTMRSNDIIYGFQFDVFMFTMLQETIANELGIDVGPYIHEPASLHVYEKGFNFDCYEMLGNMGIAADNVRLVNNGMLKDWSHIAYIHTSELKYNKDEYDHSSTTQEIQWLIEQERKRKAIVSANDKLNLGQWKQKAEKAPTWAKPYLNKWGN